jgi:D-arabinono-1,4-lactone oxidase
MIDGRGEVYEVDRDRTPEDFHATVTSMGLLGIISKVVLRCVPTFNITGQEAITRVEDASVDLFGEGDAERPSLAGFLARTEYARLEWFPQRQGERLLVWQAQRIEPEPGFRPTRYQEFTGDPEVSQTLASLFYTLLGNLDDLRAARSKLEPIFEQVDDELIQYLACLGRLGQPLVEALTLALEGSVEMAIEVLALAAPLLGKESPRLMGLALDAFLPLDSTKKGQDKGEPQCFRDWSWRGLPMDNQVIDALLPTTFTELWIPLSYSQRAMSLLNDYFDEPATAQEALRRTGTYAIELYGAPPNSAWMSMSYSDGKDVWRDGVLRIDFYWFKNNAGNPAKVFYPQFWKLLRDNGIPFRLHWGKGQPVGSPEELADWAAFFRGQYARWDDFLERRRKLDPNNIFLTGYWRQRFNLSHLPAPQPRGDAEVPRIRIVPARSKAVPDGGSRRWMSKTLAPLPQQPSWAGDTMGWGRRDCWVPLATALLSFALALGSGALLRM